MANTIKFKRGAAAGIPTLASGEPGWTTDTHALYVGTGSGNVLIGPSDLSAYLTASTAAVTYLSLATAASTYLTIATAASTYLSIAGAAAAYQPLDADLTSLGGASGTNTIYYRSAPDTWSAVTIGGNLSFSGGTLNLSATYAGQSSIVTVGTLTAGATGAGFTIALTTSTVTGNLPVANLPALSGLTTADPAFDDTLAGYDLSAGANRRFTAERLLALLLPTLCEHRLTITTLTPVPSASSTSSTLYLTRHQGNRLTLYDGTRWVLRALDEIAFAPTLTASKVYDIWAFTSTAAPSSTNTSTDIVTMPSATGWATGSQVIPDATGGGLTAGTTYYWNAASSTTGSFHTTVAAALAGTSKVDLTASITANLTAVSLEALVWTDDTTRATVLTRQDGCYVKTGDATRKYLGTIKSDGSGLFADSNGTRFVWNMYNRVYRQLSYYESTDSWTYSTNSYRQANANTGALVKFVVGLAVEQLYLRASLSFAQTGVPSVAWVGIGVNSTTVNNATMNVSAYATSTAIAYPALCSLMTRPAEGYTYCALLEKAWGPGTTGTTYGDNGTPTDMQHGIEGGMVM